MSCYAIQANGVIRQQHSSVGTQQKQGGTLLRIHFRVEDLARLRMAPGLGPVAEGVFALNLLGNGSGGTFDRWRERVRDDLADRLEDVENLLRDHRPLPDLLWMIERTGRTRHNDPAVTSVVFEFCQVAVMPYWNFTRAHLEAARDAHGRVAIANGVERVLGMLHPKLHWNPPVLEIRTEPDRDIHLRGRGLLLSPSLFLGKRAMAFIDRERETGLPALAFSVPIDAMTTPPWRKPEKADEDALGALVGHTRAAALQVLTDGCTTGELSQRLGISLAGASKHATVLRKAGLITTSRNRNTAMHTLTQLGMALLRRHKWEMPHPRRMHIPA